MFEIIAATPLEFFAEAAVLDQQRVKLIIRLGHQMFERTEALLDLFQVALRRIDQLADGLVIDRVQDLR